MKRTLLLIAMLLPGLDTAAFAQPSPRVLAPNTGAGDFVQNRMLHTWPPFLHWDLREFPGCQVPWALGPGAVPDLDNNGADNEAADRTLAANAFGNAFGAWAAVSPALISFTQTAGGPAPGGLAMDGHNTLTFGDGGLDDVQTVDVDSAVVAGGIVVAPGPNGLLESQPQGDDLISGANIVDGGNLVAESTANNQGAVGGALGLTGLFFNNQTGVILESDVVFSSAVTWVLDPAGNDCAAPSFNLRGVATHEVGHMIGVAHPNMVDPPAADAADGVTPTMHAFICQAFGGNSFNNTLENADEDPCNFLYTPDLGDAPDPWMGVFNLYPTLVHDVGKGRILNGIQLDAPAKGAEHIFGIKPRQGGRNYTYEWLARFDGPGATPECEANIVNKDPLDDGVTWYPNPPIWGRPLTVTAWLKYARDAEGNAHDYPARGLFANAWIDLNQNCIWEEWFLSAGFGPVPPPGANTVATTIASGTVLLPPAIDPALPVWLRARVDYGEHVGTMNNIDGTLAADKGAAQFGEVEDYPLTCNTRYEQQWPFHPLPYPVDGVAMVFVGASEPGDQLWSPQVDGGDCITGTDPSPLVTDIPSLDEMVVEYPVPLTIPPSVPKHSGICRPINPPVRPVTLLRTFWLDESMPLRAATSQADVPTENRIPSVNCGGGLDNDTGAIDFAVGTVDLESGGWISLVDPVNRVWSDQINVTVSYRLSPTLIPLESLSPCDPAYASLPLTLVGTGTVNPEDAFEFVLTADEVPSGHFVILEVESSWETNGTVNRQIVEFPEPFGEPTPVGDAPAPRQLVLENYPNPFNPGTTIRYSLPEAAVASLRVYDVAGRLVRTLFAGQQVPAGRFEIEWDGRDERGAGVASGVYFFRIDAGQRTFTRKAVLLK